jgi:hypothetical protein
MIADLGKSVADFTTELGTDFPVVVVDVLSGGIAVGATDGVKNGG